jgi:histidyl-tRNA synthetase
LAETIRGIKGMHDVLPDKTPRWQRLEQVICDVLDRYGYREIRIPVLEQTELFERSIGEATDIVSKEMYTFTDRGGERLTLRPEGTAGCVRAGIEGGLFQQGTLRLWYRGPMFRREKPQKGRFRQFHQVGAEAFGMPGPDIDAELILLTGRIWKELGIADPRLELNTLGSTSARQHYREVLTEYFAKHIDALDEDSRNRLQRNPLRILDSKNPGMQELILSAPSFEQHVDADSLRQFEELGSMLDAAGLAYKVNHRLVRGLDYYNGIVFEWISDELGAQGAICAGGRYDGLVEHFGGRPTPGVGFAMGLERILDLFDPPRDALNDPHAYLVVEPAAAARALQLAEMLRDRLPALRIVTHCGGGSLKSQFRRADRSGATLALVLGDAELRADAVGIKPLRGSGDQDTVPLAGIVAELARRLPI